MRGEALTHCPDPLYLLHTQEADWPHGPPPQGPSLAALVVPADGRHPQEMGG